MSKTFDEWSDAGYKIKKGSKSASRNDRGIPTFTSDQVEKKRMPLSRKPATVVMSEEAAEYKRQMDWEQGSFPDDDIPF